MLLLWPSLLLLTLHCTCLTWPVTCQTTCLPGASDDIYKLSRNEYESKKILRNVLRGLNRSEPPRVKWSVVKTYDIKDKSPRLMIPGFQAADQAKNNVVSFNLSSCVSTHILDVNNAFMKFYVSADQHVNDTVIKKQRPYRDRMKKRINKLKKRIYKLRKKKALLKKRLQKCKNRLHKSVEGSSYQPHSLPNSENSSITTDPPVNFTLDRPSESSASADLSRIHRVKVVVRLVSTPTNRRRTISEKQIQVKPDRFVEEVSVPVEDLRSIADTEDHTLSLQIVCKDCGRHVWIERVFERQRRNGKKMKPTENEFRPILVIEMKNSICTEQPRNSLAPESDSSTTE